jgi:hypothetical protein
VLTESGGTAWFFIAADCQFGYSLQEGAERFVKQAAGQSLATRLMFVTDVAALGQDGCEATKYAMPWRMVISLSIWPLPGPSW